MDPGKVGVARAVSVYGGASALRGIKIDVKKAAPDQVSIPDAVRHCTFNPGEFLYNFSLEKDVIRRAQERRKASLAQIADEQVERKRQPEGTNVVLAPTLSGGILLPTVLATVPGGQPPVQPAEERPARINFAEFEDQSSNPFEEVALQTIDDMGELRQILQPAGSETAGSDSTDQTTGAQSEGSPEQRKHKVPVPKPRVRPGQVGGPVPKPRPRKGKGDAGRRLPPGAKPTAFAAAAAVAAAPTPPSDTEKPPSYDSLHTGGAPLPSSDALLVRGMEELPPPYEADSSLPARPRPAPRHSFGGEPPQPAGIILPNPYDKLKQNERQFVDRIGSMGFPQDRVARVVQKVGPDDREVFDVLVSISKIEDLPLRYPANSAEVALFNNKLNVEKSLEVLKLVFELKELGFSEEKIHDALKQNDNDKDKAIDFLISKSVT
eukprot:m.309764 g.309764  ORF g.309764 m.309764 type:complete len:436 (+) comp47661_c0_seq1:137-1444(+)